MGDMDRAYQLVRDGNQKSGIDTYFGFFLTYFFVMLLFLNQNMLDWRAKHLISNLTSHTNTNDQWLLAMKAKAYMEQDSKLNHAVPPNQYVSARMEGRKRKCVRCINRAKNTQGLQSGNKSGIFVTYISKNFPCFLVKI